MVDNSNPDGTRDLAVTSHDKIDTVNGSVNSSDLINEVATPAFLTKSAIANSGSLASSGFDPGDRFGSKTTYSEFIQFILMCLQHLNYILFGLNCYTLHPNIFSNSAKFV